MARERENYRQELAALQEAFPNKSVLTMPEVSKYLRCDRRTLLKDKSFPIRMIGNKYIITVVALAKYLS